MAITWGAPPFCELKNSEALGYHLHSMGQLAETVRVKQLNELWVWAAALCFLLVAASSLSSKLALPFPVCNMPYCDHLGYKGAFDAAQLGENPYWPDTIRPIHEAHLNISLDRVDLLMPNPPWTLTVAYPFLAGSYSYSRLAWLAMTIVFIAASARLAQSAFSLKLPFGIFGVLLPFIFYPSLKSIQQGQIGGILALGFGCLLYGYSRRARWVGGFGLILLSIKPHLFVPLMAALPSLERRAKVSILLPACILFFSLAIATEFFWPGIILTWIVSMSTLDTQVGSIALNSITESPATYIGRRSSLTPAR